MKYTIDIDTGGTFTDGFFACGHRIEKVKVDTTPHDLTVCFNNCIEEGAQKFGLNSASDLLADTEVIRLSTTVGTNTLIQRSGPKIGVIVTKGFESNLYSVGTNPILNFLVLPEMVIGLDEEIGPTGSLVKPVEESEVRAAVRSLLESGARIIVVSLRRSYENPANERKLREIVEADYPRHYLGSVPLLLSWEMCIRPDDATKTNVAIINAYLHKELVHYLYKADDDLRRHGYGKPLLIVHTAGGVARVAKTKAVDTYRSGPTAGLMGTAYLSQANGLENVVSLDVGGTSTDIGLVLNGKWTYSFDSQVAGVPIGLPTVEVTSVGGGGGSIARVDPDTRRIRVGPESAGARPGPACYGLGNEQPTVTDACVALGYIDPDYFLGGRRKLRRDLSLRALDKVAKEAGLSVEEASLSVVKGLERIAVGVADELLSRVPRGSDGLALFSFGGGGGLICASVAAQIGASRVYTFPFSSVFSAFGSSTMNVVHAYERLARVPIRGPDGVTPERAERLDQLLAEMSDAAYRDMRGEGFRQEQVSFTIEAELSAEGAGVRGLVALPGNVLNANGLQSLCADFERQVGITPSTPAIVMLDVIRLKAECATSHCAFRTFEDEGENPDAGLKGTRQVLLDISAGFRDVPVYEQSRLRCGNVVHGPAIVDSEDTTVLVPANRKYRIDTHLNGIIEEA